jgi:acyl-CoA synthetase (AMP-forming)/AMP-acid ligase II
VPYSYDSSAYRATFESNFTFLSGFWRNVRRYGARPALIDPGLTGPARSWTYAELGDLVGQLARGLSDRGVQAGDVVTFQLYNCAEFAQLYLAVEQLGAIASPINFRFSSGETAHVLDDSLPKVFVYDAGQGDAIGTALELAEHRPATLIAVDGDPEIDGAERFDDLATAPGIGTPQGQRSAWDETLRLYTSGTTGMPKGVSLNNAAEVLTAHDVIMHFPLSPQDRTLNMTPWFHRGGISAGGPQPVLYAGAASVIMRQFDADAVLDLVQSEGLTFLVGAPTNLGLLAAAQESNPRDLSSLRGIVTMGAPLERAACLRFQSVLTARIFNGYGTTEAFWNTFLRPADLPDHAGTAGQACTDDDVRVVAVYDDHPAAPDDLAPRDGKTTGEVIMRSLKSGYAYVNKPDEQQAKFRDGWLYSGDIGTWDADEFVTIVGRKDDMIISGGENVHPVQVEEVLNAHPSVADSIVVGLPDSRWGELVVAYVETSDSELTAGELDKHCLASPMLADFKRPRRYRFVAELPRTATGKKMHYVIRDEVRQPDAAATLVHP